MRACMCKYICTYALLLMLFHHYYNEVFIYYVLLLLMWLILLILLILIYTYIYIIISIYHRLALKPIMHTLSTTYPATTVLFYTRVVSSY